MTNAIASPPPSADLPRAGTPGVLAGVGGLPRRSAWLILLGSLPLVGVTLITAVLHPGYRFFPVALLAGIWLAVRDWREQSADSVPGTQVGTALLLGLAFFVAICSTLLWSTWGGVMAALLAMVGLAWWAGGWPAVRTVLPGLVLVGISVPPPFALDRALLGWAGAKGVTAASRLLHALAVPHVIGGQVLEVPGLKLPLAALRDLMNTVPFVVAFAWGYSQWLRRPVWRRLLTVVAGAAFAVFLAVLTAALGVRSSYAYGVDLFAGARGWLLLAGGAAVACALVASFDQAAQFIFAPLLSGSARNSTATPRSGPGPRVWVAGPAKGLGSWGAWAFALLGIVQLPLAGWFLYRELAPAPPLVSRWRSGAGFALAGVTPPWSQVPVPPAYFPTLRTNAATRGIWYLDAGMLAAAVLVEYPVRADAAFTVVDPGDGWQLLATRQVAGEANGSPPWTEGLAQKEWEPTCSYWLGVLEESGRWREPSPRAFRPWAPFQARVRGPLTLRVLVLAVGREAMTDADRERVASLFQQARVELGRQFTAGLLAP